MDGSVNLRLVSPYPDETFITLSITNVRATYLQLSIYCQGQLILNTRRVNHTGDLTIETKWNQLDFFTEQMYGEAYCTAFVGAKYKNDDDYVWCGRCC